MLTEIVLSLYPSALNCVTWSEDYEVALAAGEHVQLLVTPTSVQTESEMNAHQNSISIGA